MSVKANKDKFIVQAGILALAGIISRVIGLLYRSPLTAIIGDEGIGYYASAYNIYTIILLISSYSIPSAISKLVAQKLAGKQYIDAHRIFMSAIYYVLIVGTIAGLFLFFAADVLVDGPAITVLKVFAPTIFIYGLLGVLRGYFQAHKSMLHTSISQIAEQILNCVVSIGAAVLFISMSLSTLDKFEITQSLDVKFGQEIVGVAEVIQDENGEVIGYELTQEQKEWNTKHATYGAIGSACGTGVGVITALVMMYFMYHLNKEYFKRRMRKDSVSEVLSYALLMRQVIRTITPFILSTALYNVSTALNQTIFTKYMIYIKQEETTSVATQYGVFSGKAVVIANIPIALSSAMASAIIPSIATAIEENDMDSVQEKVASSIKATMLISIPAAIGIFVLARPITWILYPQRSSIDLATSLLSILAISIVFYSLSTLTNGILQGIGKIKVPVWHTAIALILQTLLLGALLVGTPMGLYSMAIANIAYSVIISVLNQFALRKWIGYSLEWRRTIVIPTISAIFMGVVAYLVYSGIYALCNIELVAVIPAILSAGACYFILVLKLKGLNQAELLELPKGRSLVKIARKCRLI